MSPKGSPSALLSGNSNTTLHLHKSPARLSSLPQKLRDAQILLNSSNKAVYDKHAYQGNYVDEVKEYKWKI